MRAAATAAVLLFAGSVHAADENKDVDLIPQAPAQAQAASPVPSVDRGNQRIYVENALGFSSLRDDLLVPQPPPLPPKWEEHLFADARLQWAIAPNAFIAYSGRLSLVAEEDLGFPNRGNLTHDLRELYASTEPRPRDYVDAGRINVKSGVALGFNPTDFFKARAVVDPLTADPSALRENRLGTLMLRAQHVGERATVSALYAPRVTDPAPIGDDRYRGFDPLFDRTNGTNRWLVKASAQLGNGVNPEAMLFGENGQVKTGVNLAESVGQSTVVYAEWAGGRQLGIADQALAFGRATGSVPAS